MALITQTIRAQLPKLYGQEQAEVTIAYVKLFHPLSNWTWYITEFDGLDLCFGLSQGFEEELGYFSLSELESLRVRGLGIERDLHFKPCPLSQVRKADKEVLAQ